MSFSLAAGRDGRSPSRSRGTQVYRQRSTGRSFQGPPASGGAFGRSPSVGRSSSVGRTSGNRPRASNPNLPTWQPPASGAAFGRSPSVERSPSNGRASGIRSRGSNPNLPTWQQGSPSSLPVWQRNTSESPSPRVIKSAWSDKEPGSPQQAQQLTSSQSIDNQDSRSSPPEPIKPVQSKFQTSGPRLDPPSNMPQLDLPIFVASFPSTLASFPSRNARPSVPARKANPDENLSWKWKHSPSAADGQRSAAKLNEDPPRSPTNSWQTSLTKGESEVTMSKSIKSIETPDFAATSDARSEVTMNKSIKSTETPESSAASDTNAGTAERESGLEMADFAVNDQKLSKQGNSASAKCIRISDFAVTDFDPTMQQSALARSTAMACGLPATYGHGHETAKSNSNAAIAMKMLEASRKQREHQESLLHQAQKQMLQAARNEHEKAMREATKRVGGAESANPAPNTSMRLQQRLALAGANPAVIESLNQSVAPTPRFPPQSPRARQAVSPRGTPTATRRQRSQSPWSFTAARYNKPQDFANGSSPNSSFSSSVGTPDRTPPSVKSASRMRRQVWQSSQPVSPRGGALAQAQLNSPSDVVDESTIVDSLLERKLLSSEPRPWAKDPEGIPDDIAHVQAMFCAQLPDSCVSRVLRLENRQSALCAVYDAVRQTVTMANELELWHGTSFESVRNIVLNGFNRAYCGRHGTKLGNGTYFATSAQYSKRFCDPKQKKKVVILADVIAGCWTKGSPDLIEPPHIDEECLSRYDSTVDDVDNPTMFCVFRDFQALPRYLVEFAISAST